MPPTAAVYDEVPIHTLAERQPCLDAPVLVPFHGLAMPSWRDERTGVVSVALRPIVEHLGLNWSGQRQRVQRDELYCNHLTECVTHSVQGSREMLGLDLKRLPMFLGSINRQRVKEPLRPLLLAFQQECAEVLADYWFPHLRQLEKLDDTRLKLQHEVRTLEQQRRDLGPVVDTVEALVASHLQAWLADLAEPQRRVLQLMAQQKAVRAWDGPRLALMAGVLWRLRDEPWITLCNRSEVLHRGRQLLRQERTLHQRWPVMTMSVAEMGQSLAALFHRWGYDLHAWPGKFQLTRL